MVFWKAEGVLYKTDVLYFGEKQKKVVKIVAEKTAF
jgi:hypothetical protein